MKVYMVQFDGEQSYVEAESMAEAVRLWREAVTDEREFDGTEEPESCALIHDAPVIRGSAPPVPEIPSPNLEALLGNPHIIDALGALENARHALSKAPADALATCNWIDAQSRLVRDVARVARGESPAPVPEQKPEAAPSVIEQGGKT